MNPQTNGAPELNLPPPIVAEASTFDPNMVPAAAYETPAAPAATAAAGNPLMPAMTLPVPSAPLPLIAQGSVVNTASNANPAVADDADLIEKEWVQKAKDIIKQTQSDPHVQSKELNIFKADYMQKRYNKVLKLSE